MRFVVSKEQFLKALNAANHAIVLKNPIPTLANFKLELSEKVREALSHPSGCLSLWNVQKKSVSKPSRRPLDNEESDSINRFS